MTRTISLITATVGAALLFAVPAWGDNWGADQQRDQQVGYLNPDVSDYVAAAKATRQVNMLDARERALGVAVGSRTDPLVARERALSAKSEITLGSDFYADGFAQAVRPRDLRPDPVRDDRFTIDPTSGSTPVTATSSSSIDWGQIGIGFGIGLVLALGLYLAMRFTRIRPLAH